MSPRPAEQREPGPVQVAARHAAWSGTAFGLGLQASFPISGAPPSQAAPDRPLTRLELILPRELDAAWRGGERISHQKLPNGRTGASIEEHGRDGYLLYGAGYGRYWISRSGDWIRCAPPKIAAWRWQRYLIGQALPFAALLRGYEVFHASAALANEGALVLVGPSGVGKSSLAVALALMGFPLICDDVLTLERADGRLLAWPGAPLLSVRQPAATVMPAVADEALGPVVGVDRHAFRIATDLYSGPSGVRTICFLERAPRNGESAIEALRPVDPRLLLASTYNFVVRSPERLVRQLDVAADLARTTSAYRVTIGPDKGPSAMARDLVDRLAIEREPA